MTTPKHLPLFGIGPFYAGLSVLLTFSACLLNRFRLIPNLSFHASEIILKIFSIICFFIAAILWLDALFIQKIDKHIMKNELVTTGAYRWVRNPIYSAIMLIMWSFLAWTGNLYILLLCPVYPLFMWLLLKPTEEKWLTEQYGQPYLDYCKQVNRCIPWFPKMTITNSENI